MIYAEESPALGENAYWVFISFLYAVIAADIAERLWKVSRNWWKYKKSKSLKQLFVVYSHLVLAGFVVGTSFLGWTQAFAVHRVLAPPEVISWWSLLVMVDFAILAMYFNLVHLVGAARTPEEDDDRETQSQDNRQSSHWVFWILIMYCVWDVATYLGMPWLSCREVQGGVFWSACWMSLFCAFLAGAARYHLLYLGTANVWVTVSGDFSLLWLVLFYRVLKQLAAPCPEALGLITKATESCQILHLATPVRNFYDQLFQLFHPCLTCENWQSGAAWMFFIGFVVSLLCAGCMGFSDRPPVKGRIAPLTEEFISPS